MLQVSDVCSGEVDCKAATDPIRGALSLIRSRHCTPPCTALYTCTVARPRPPGARHIAGDRARARVPRSAAAFSQ